MTDEDIKALTDTKLCVCHIQSDCPTHPKGDFGAMTDLEIRKACHNLITGGKGKWHELKKPFLCACGYIPNCPSRRCNGCMSDHIERSENPDPLNNAQDYLAFLFFVVNEWEGWEDFQTYQFGKESNGQDFGDWWLDASKHLLKDQRALPTSVAIYEKERE